MINARIIGKATSIVKHRSLDGQKLLLAAPLSSDLNKADGPPILVIDTLGAGIGDIVLLTSDSKHAAELLGTSATPVRWTTIGILDDRAY